MSTHILHAPFANETMGPASCYVRESREAMLAYETDELAALRFSIILTARWEAATDEDSEHRAELREDLALLRRHYNDTIDEIAMTFGVAQAMKTKEEVERSVIVPREMQSLPRGHNDRQECSADEEGGYHDL